MVTAEFVNDNLLYLHYLINEVLQQTGLSTDIIEGLAAFDSFIMFKWPMEVALGHFDLLYRTFCLRSWVSKNNESVCRDQYTQLLDDLRICYGPNSDMTSTSQDLIEFLLELNFLQDRDHLLYLIKLCCLSATTPCPTYPDVKMGSTSTAEHQSRLNDEILPCQSYIARVSGSVALSSVDANLENFSLLAASFGRSAFSPTYDPWTSFDAFGRFNVYKSLQSSYRSVLSGPKKTSARSETEDSVENKSALKPPSDSKRRTLEKNASRSTTSSMVAESTPGSSNS